MEDSELVLEKAEVSNATYVTIGINAILHMIDEDTLTCLLLIDKVWDVLPFWNIRRLREDSKL